MTRRQMSSRLFIRSAIWILGVTAVLKILSVMGEAKLLSQPDPIFAFLTRRQVLFVAAIMECFVVWNLTHIRRSDQSKLFSLTWLALIFGAYRGALWIVGYKGACSCLGTLLPVNPNVLDWVMLIVLLYLFCFSLCFLLRNRMFPKLESISVS